MLAPWGVGTGPSSPFTTWIFPISQVPLIPIADEWENAMNEKGISSFFFENVGRKSISEFRKGAQSGLTGNPWHI